MKNKKENWYSIYSELKSAEEIKKEIKERIKRLQTKIKEETVKNKKKLTKNEFQTIRKRQRGMTYIDIGKKLNFTKQRAEQLEKSAKIKLAIDNSTKDFLERKERMRKTREKQIKNSYPQF